MTFKLPKMVGLTKISSIFICMQLLATNLAHAQSPTPILELQLNSTQQIEQSCRITFLATNGLSNPIKNLSLETVLIDIEGGVERLTLFDFQELPIGKPRVRQFDLPDLSCSALSRILINGADNCEGEQMSAAKCIEHLNVRSRISIELLG